MSTAGTIPVKWSDNFYLRCYQLAKQGLKLTKMAQVLKISPEKLRRWTQEKPALLEAINKGFSESKKAEGTSLERKTFTDYVYMRLPPEIKPIWDRIVDIDKEDNFEKRVEMLLANHGKSVRQHLFVHALAGSNFNVTEACRRIGIGRSMFDSWVRTDPDFVEIMNQLHVAKKDFIENALMGLVGQGDTTAVIFASKTLNADRGYGTKSTVEHLGSIGHAIVDVNTLKPELQLAVLNAIREGRGEEKIPERIVPKSLGPIKNLPIPEFIEGEEDVLEE